MNKCLIKQSAKMLLDTDREKFVLYRVCDDEEAQNYEVTEDNNRIIRILSKDLLDDNLWFVIYELDRSWVEFLAGEIHDMDESGYYEI